MDIKTRHNWMLLRPTPLARWCILLALLSTKATPAFSFTQGTPEERMACTPDVLRLCSAFIPNADEITSCLREKSAELSDACRIAVAAGTKQLPVGSESNGTRKTPGKMKGL